MLKTSAPFGITNLNWFADSGGWGYGAFRYEAANDSWRPFTTSDQPPQENDAKCGFACHSVVEKNDYVFSVYARR